MVYGKVFHTVGFIHSWHNIGSAKIPLGKTFSESNAKWHGIKCEKSKRCCNKCQNVWCSRHKAISTHFFSFWNFSTSGNYPPPGCRNLSLYKKIKFWVQTIAAHRKMNYGTSLYAKIFTSRVSGRGNIIGPVCVFVCLCVRLRSHG